jgi:hypothetical protein
VKGEDLILIVIMAVMLVALALAIVWPVLH